MNKFEPLLVHIGSHERHIMKSITIHNLDDTLESLIKEKAKQNGLSLNRTIKMLLKKSFGLGTEVKEDHKNDFIDFSGKWSAKDEKEFNNNTKDLSKINSGDWE